jgi:hypothetical protein
MAFEYAGDLNGAHPVVRKFTVGADVYQGQLVCVDFGLSTGGDVVVATVAEALPSVTQHILGICTGVVTSPTYTASYYNGDLATYSYTQATLAAYDPPGPATVEVTLITPTTLIKGPIWQTTPGTALTVGTATSASSGGTAYTGNALTATEDSYSTLYCRSGANAGQYRKITEDGGTTTQTVKIPFTYGIAIGDTFVAANVVMGHAHIDWVGTYINAIDGGAAVGTYCFAAYVHELNLKESGKEYCIFTLANDHLVIGGNWKESE